MDKKPTKQEKWRAKQKKSGKKAKQFYLSASEAKEVRALIKKLKKKNPIVE